VRLSSRCTLVSTCVDAAEKYVEEKQNKVSVFAIRTLHGDVNGDTAGEMSKREREMSTSDWPRLHNC
jgi:hypothetical protein